MRTAGNRAPRDDPPRAPEGEGWRSTRRLLAGPLRPLVAGQVLGQAADGLAQITFAQVVLFEAGRGATPFELTKLLAVTLLPFSVVGPFAGVVIDRWDRRRTLVRVSLGRVALATASVGVLVVHSQAPAYLGVVLLLSSSRFVLAAKGAALPRTVASSSLVTANAISSLVGSSAAFVGAVAGSAFVARAPAAGFAAAAAAYLGAARCFATLPAVGGGEAPVPLVAGLRRVVDELADGVRTVARVSAVRRPLVAVWAHRLLLGAGFILLVLIADRRYHLEASGYGLALAVTGVGALGGTLTAPAVARRYRPSAVLPVTFVAAALAALVGGFRPTLGVLVAGLGLVAFAFQVLKVLVDALVQDAAPDAVRGRVFAAYDVLYNVAFVCAGLALVPLWRAGREHVLLWWLAAAFTAGGAALAYTVRGWPFEPRAAPHPVGHRWRARSAALVVGALPALAFPAADVWWLGWIGFVPLLVLIRSAPGRREATARAWSGGAGFFLAAHHWLVPNIGPFAVPAAVLLGALLVPWGRLAWALLGPTLTIRRLAAATLLLPSAWVAAEYLRSWEGLGGPWALLGVSQWRHPLLVAPAALGGVWAVSFILAAANTAVAAALGPCAPAARRTALGVAGALVAATLAVGALRSGPAPGRSLRIAGVQPGVVQGPELRFAAGEAATLGLASRHPDLVVWGESSVGFDLDSRPDLLARLEAASRAVGADLLVNVDARRGLGGIFKSSVLVGPDGELGRYDKMRLVPFGEYIPLRPVLGWLSRVTAAAAENRRRGRQLVLLHARGAAIGPLVCFESAFPDLSRSLAAKGADLIVVQSATTTFQGSWAPAQHASLAAVRAVETGRPVLHATLTGVSAAFDAHGRRLLWFDTHHRGVYVITVPLTHSTTPYVRLGDWVPVTSFGLLLTAALALGLRAARRGPEPPVITGSVPTLDAAT